VISTNNPTAYYTKIIDLGKDDDFEIRIPYQQSIAWLTTNPVFNYANIAWSTSTTPTFIHNPATDNGTIVVRVLTQLTAPVATSSISILWSMRGTENLEFANPVQTPMNQSVFQTQSAIEQYPGAQHLLLGGGASKPAKERYLVNQGEAVMSMRTLMRRTTLSKVWVNVTVDTDVDGIFYINTSKFPLYYGFDPTGVDGAKGVIATTTNQSFNWAFNSLYNWLAPAFVGQRGSMIKTYNCDGPIAYGSVRVYRTAPNLLTQVGTTYTHTTPTNYSIASSFYWNNSNSGGSGQALTSQLTNAGLSVLIPNYNQYRFQSTNPSFVSAPNAADGSAYDGYTVEVSCNDSAGPKASNCKIWEYTCIGTDFNLFMFLNVPTTYLYTATPVAV